MNAARSRLPVALGLASLLAVWALVALFASGVREAVPTPWAVLQQMHDDGLQLYLDNGLVTLQGATTGFVWGNVLALAVALLVMVVPALEQPAEQIAVVSYCMPLTAIGPIVLVIAGGRAPTVFLAAMSVFFTTLVGTLHGLRQADPTALDLVRAYGGGRWQQIVRVRTVAALPAVVNSLKLAAPGAMLGAILGEYLGGIDSGLGVALTNSQQSFEVARTWALALTVGVLAGAGYALFAGVGLLVRWWMRASAAGAGLSTAAARGRQHAGAAARLGHEVLTALGPLVASVVVTGVLWFTVLRVFEVNTLIGKTPGDVVTWLFASPTSAENRTSVLDPLMVTLRHGTTGFTAGMVAALVVALLFALSPAAEGMFMPVALILRSVPLVALTPLVVLVFGRGTAGIAVISGIVVFFPALVTIVHGLRSTPVAAQDLVAVYGGRRAAHLRLVALPHALPDLLAAAKLSVPGCLVGALVAEWLATGDGIGGAILSSIAAFGYSRIWASIAALTLVSVLAYTVVGVVEQVLRAELGRT